MTEKTCVGCSYYELTVLNILPFEYCHKHKWSNKKPNDFVRCNDYTTSKWIRIKIWIKILFGRDNNE